MNTLKQVIRIPSQKSYNSLRVLKTPRKIAWQKLAIDINNEIRFIPFEDIIYCKAISNYTTVFVKSGKSYVCCKTLKDIESRLPEDDFLRIHQSYVVNIHFITALKKREAELEIDNKLMLPISRSKRSELFQLINI